MSCEVQDVSCRRKLKFARCEVRYCHHAMKNQVRQSYHKQIIEELNLYELDRISGTQKCYSFVLGLLHTLDSCM